MLSIKNLQLKLSSKKLFSKFIEFFYVKESVKAQIYYLILSTASQIHFMFHVSLLEFYVDSKNSLKTMSENIFVDDEKQYEIEKILNKKNSTEQT